MKRIGIAGMVTMVVFALLGAAHASAAPTQASGSCAGTTDSEYPPDGVDIDIDGNLVLVSGSVDPGGSGELVFEGATPGESYGGVLYSDPITLGPSVADADGGLTFTFSVPSDFDLEADHHIDLCLGEVLAAAFEVCVSSSGAVTAGVCVAGADGVNSGGTTGGALPFTGGAHLLDFLKLALLLLAIGAALSFWRRRRAASVPTA